MQVKDKSKRRKVGSGVFVLFAFAAGVSAFQPFGSSRDPKPSSSRAATQPPAAMSNGFASTFALSEPPISGRSEPLALHSRFYADDSFWNVPISLTPQIDPNSKAIVKASLLAHQSSANFANTDEWGIAVVHSRPTDPLYNIRCTRYDCDTAVSVRIPLGAKPSTKSDHHLVVIDGDREVDMWIAAFHPSSHSWSAGSRYSTDAYGWGALCALGKHCGSSVAAGFAGMGGIPRPEDFAHSVIPHALAITTPYTRSGFIACPATHTDGKHSTTKAVPLGARIQLDPAFDVNAQHWPRWKKVIARTLQVYGGYVVDTGGSLAIRGEADLNREGAWKRAGVPEGPSLTDLPWARFRVLKLERC